LTSIDAETGKPDPAFGIGGRVDVIAGLPYAERMRNYAINSTPVVVRNVVIAAANISDGPTMKEQPTGDVSGYDGRTGKRLWTFRSVPQAGEFGHDTWEDGSAEYPGATNVWSMITVDENLGYVYLPLRRADQRLLRRPPARREPVRGESRLPGRGDRQARVALSGRPSRPVGLRLPVRANPGRHNGQRQAHQRRRTSQQAGVRLRVRSEDGRAGLADRRAARAAIDGARREDLRDAAVPDKAAGVRSARDCPTTTSSTSRRN
jgi:hypothetical protein